VKYALPAGRLHWNQCRSIIIGVEFCFRHTASGGHYGERKMSEKMSDSVYKVVEVVGTSEQSISKAIESAIAKASSTLRNLGWFEVVQIRGSIGEGKVKRYQVTLKVGFSLE
jgi:dodecin